ncbi:hypothetical protein N7457_003705 [Penicillium paradoxum]|uniref:uncharacterized protein n=1 Tax=Penicillium paradoxum TaxID=176176 RepID=UPI002547682B|nr:uncharacterized protein N7457_003705 [Penicillium paradoxum]KAJ5788715.1 hypothetical protein N7457_003705 [Penicillium paradoxum]
MRHASLAVVLFACIAAAAPANWTDSIPGYGVETLEWRIPQEDGEAALEIKGTIEDVVSQLSMQNPNAAAEIRERGKRELAKRSHLIKRDHITHSHCNFPGVLLSAVGRGMDYINGLPGRPTNGPGPGNCGRVSCSNSAGIWWCNDSPHTKTLDSWSEIGDGVLYLYQGCAGDGGQVFFDGDWNVIVRRADC